MKYIIKKVIIGVLIGIILMLFSSYVNAESYVSRSANFPIATCKNCTMIDDNYKFSLPSNQSVAIKTFELHMSNNNFNITTNDEYFKFSIVFSTINWSGGSTISSIDIGNANCQKTGIVNSGSTQYADGTYSNSTMSDTICSYSFGGTNVNYSQIGEESTYSIGFNVGYRLNGSTTNYNRCYLDSANGNSMVFICPIVSNGYVSQLAFNTVYHSPSDIYFYLNRYAVYFYKTYDKDILNALQNGNQQVINSINQNTQATQEQTDTIKSDNVSGASSSADDMVNNSAYNDSVGLDSIIKLPLNFINSLSNTCQPINLTVPYMNFNITIPCIQSVINNYMPSLVIVIKTFVNGLIIYRILLELVDIIKGAKNPNDDRLEVLDL